MSDFDLEKWLRNELNVREWKFEDWWRFLTGLAIIYFSIHLSANSKFMREQVYPNCNAVCETRISELTEIELDVTTKNIMCKCNDVDVMFYFNNLSYVREPVIDDYLGFNFS